MTRILILASLLLPGMLLHGQQAYWQQRLHYTINVSLNKTDRALDGFLKLHYHNKSPDTLSYIWFHLWPNAYKSDRTAFSEQLLENGRTDFYFAPPEQRGFINRLQFRSEDRTLEVEDHPVHIDIVRLNLFKPLLPGDSVVITTPFHVQLPYTFSRSGYKDGLFSITQWYPKPAVYDKEGWHPMPYLDQGEFYSEFASFDVSITVPDNFVVAATGELLTPDEKQWLETGAPRGRDRFSLQTNEIPSQTKQANTITPQAASDSGTKTLRYYQDNVHDFAWFASEHFRVSTDTVIVPGGHSVRIFAFSRSVIDNIWANAVAYAKQAIQFRSSQIGAYPYQTVSVVEGNSEGEGGMEYPGITVISGASSDRMLDFLVEHELGHNWFYGILASNERKHPWMDEGMNTFYGNRYMRQKYGTSNVLFDTAVSRKLPEDEADLLLRWLYAIRRDQPINTSSDRLTPLNYAIIAYMKTGKWLEHLETIIGSAPFDSMMRTYYTRWKFRHPGPNDFRTIAEQFAGRSLETEFNLLAARGPLSNADTIKRRQLKLTIGANLRDTDKYHYLGILPVLGFNLYDGLMPGIGIHNYSLPPSNLRFFVAPMFGTRSGKLTGSASIQQNFFSYGKIRRIMIGVSGGRFSTREGIDSTGDRIQAGFWRIVPTIRTHLSNRDARSTKETVIEWKTFLIGENSFRYSRFSGDDLFYPSATSYRIRYINQLSLNLQDYRKLYPYDMQLQIQQGASFYRAAVTAHQFFNYGEEGGLNARFFAAKFGYLGQRTAATEFETLVYQPKLTGVRGYEDYTYSNYFIGRGETDGIGGRQIMMRDGGLKLRTDLFQGLQGRSDDWIASINLNSTLPPGLFPVKLPLRLFLDVGTYAEGWSTGAPTARFLYVGGLQVSVFKDLLNIYAPLLYSRAFRDSFRSVPDETGFLKRISFSIDLHRFDLRKVTDNQLPF